MFLSGVDSGEAWTPQEDHITGHNAQGNAVQLFEYEETTLCPFCNPVKLITCYGVMESQLTQV